MDQDIQEIRSELKKIARLTESNTSMLQSIQRRARLTFLFSILRWTVIIGLAIGAFYYVQPFLEQIAAIYQHISGGKIDFLNLFKSSK